MARTQTLVTTARIAELLGVNPSTVTRWATDDKLPCVVLPSGVRRYRYEEIVRKFGLSDDNEDGAA